MRWCIVILVMCVWLGWLQPGGVSQAAAGDVRLALVIGHQQGWKGEQTLPWVLTGDVRPMVAELKRIGYHVLALENPSPQQARMAFQRVSAYVQRYGVKTFLFYYSGHADKRAFHLGPARQTALGYGEFLHFFLKLPVKRRFAILDACHGGQVVPLLKAMPRRTPSTPATTAAKQQPARQANQRIFDYLNHKLPKSQRFANAQELQLWYTLRLPKGVKRPKKAFDFARTPFLRREDGAGIQIIGTIGVAWHDPAMKASLLTAHLLRGLRGDADNVRDGRITMEELYNYIQARLYGKGQILNRFSLFNGNYTLAPNYQSALHVSSGIRGAIRVSIGQFTWRYEKRDARRIAIPTIPGKGVVKIHYKGRCWRQALSFPKGKSVEIDRYGSRAPCARRQAKGTIAIQATARTLPPRPTEHVFSLGVGFAQLGQAPLTTSHPAFAVGYRYRYAGAQIDYYMGQAPPGKSFAIHRLGLSLQGGVPIDINELGGFFFGLAARAGLSLAVLNQSTRVIPSLGLNAIASFRYFFLPRLGVRLGVDLGADYTPTTDSHGVSFHWNLYAAVLFRL